jgi:ribosome-associated protein YbcJ (S4-like RNA binding protein)
MKKRELKEMIKATFLSEADFTNAQDDDAALGGMYDDLYEEDLDEMIANLDEADEEESIEDILTRITGTAVDPYLAEAKGDEEETDIEVDAEEETTDGGEEKSDSIVVGKKIVSLSSLPQQTRKILDSLETLRAQAEEFGDQKFITQVGNTITFFTRDFVVAGDEPTRAKVDESLEILKMKKLAGLLTEGEYAKALLRENQTNFPSEDEIKRKGAVGDSVTVSKDGKNYDINYTISSESDDEMSFGIYDSEEGEDAEQVEEFYTYKELINWFNN